MASKNIQDAISIMPYDPSWPAMAESEKATLRSILAPAIFELAHIGSTAIPEMDAKPIIDLMIGVDNLNMAASMIAPLESIGYSYWRDNPNKSHFFFVKGLPQAGGTGRTHHVHIVQRYSDFWLKQLLFRDYLRGNPEDARNYQKLKHELSRKHGNDREAYTSAKTTFVQTVLCKAVMPQRSAIPMPPPVSLSTPRLVIRMAEESDACAIVTYFQENKAHFAPTDPIVPENFYHEAFWIERVQKARIEFQTESALRLFLFLKEDPGRLIGTISYTQMFRGPFQACYLGYGIDRGQQGKGLMYEALTATNAYLFQEMNFHRIMANHLPENTRSARLLQRLGFQVEGLAPEYLHINGAWRDHVLNSLHNPNWKQR